MANESGLKTIGIMRLIVPFNLIRVDDFDVNSKNIHEKFMFHIGRDIVLSSVRNLDTKEVVEEMLRFNKNKMDDTIEAISNIKMFSMLYINRVQTGGLVLTFTNDWIVSDYEVFHDSRLHKYCIKIIKDFMGVVNDKINIEEPFAYYNEADNNYKDEFDFIRSFDDTK